VREVKERVADVMLGRLGIELAVDRYATEHPALATLLIGPTPDDLWIVRNEDIDNLLIDRDVALVISTTDATTYDFNLSGTGQEASRIVTIPMSCGVLFKAPSSYTQITRRGRDLKLAEIVELMADIYRGAMIEVVCRDVVDGRVVLDARPLRDYSDTVWADTDAASYGRAIVEFEIKAQGAHPTPAYQIALKETP